MNRGRFKTPSPEIRRTSTVLFDDVADLEATLAATRAGDPTVSTYGTHGTPTTAALDALLLAGEGGAGVVLGPSGLAAITTALLAVLRSGDHLLMVDAAYGPTRRLCDGLLTRLGITVEYYDPLIGAGIAALIRPNTTMVWMESPGTYTFEVQDVAAIAAAARAADHRVVTAIDNTWGSPGLFRPFDHGVDLSIVALTKYWGGHADVLMGAVFANDALLADVRRAAGQLGMCTNGEDAFLVIRGARTVDLRIRAHEANALEIARRLVDQPRVGRILHPAFPDCPGHHLWRRDFHGSSGLFSFELLAPDGQPADRDQAGAFTDRLVGGGRFGLGYSWGGFESLVMPARCSNVVRSVAPWTGGELIRLHVGLEPVEELWEDLERALAAD
ncbi:MAG: cystathionine beta-lyase [Chloroflexi bacterium]|nr:cystathionine beta-lyase [Chloroflexota bacterium]